MCKARDSLLATRILAHPTGFGYQGVSMPARVNAPLSNFVYHAAVRKLVTARRVWFGIN
jgi:hypothetical protein